VKPRVAVTGFHIGTSQGASHDETLRAWNDADADLQVWSRAGKLCGGRPESLRKEEPYSGVLFPAARELVRLGLWDKGLTLDPQRVAVCFSSSKGDLARLHNEQDNWAPDAATNWWQRTLRSRGAGFSPVAACAGGAHAVAIGAQWIEDGYADVVICGALELPQTPLVLAAYERLGALSKSGVMRPFDANRDGFVPAHGVAMLVLESEEHARSRGAQKHGFISGWAMNADATAMTTMQPNGDSIARAIEIAMRRANVETVDLINAHGTATKLNDEVETRGIKKVFQSRVPLSSTKPLTGHWLGAAGALEAIICLLAMRENFAPPTLNLDTPDALCDLDCIAGTGRTLEINRCLSLSYGFGGHIGALILEKKQDIKDV